MGMLSSQADELRTMAGELRRVYEHNTDWLRDEAVTLASSVDSMREAADTIEGLRQKVEDLEGMFGELPPEGKCAMLLVKQVDGEYIWGCELYDFASYCLVDSEADTYTGMTLNDPFGRADFADKLTMAKELRGMAASLDSQGDVLGIMPNAGSRWHELFGTPERAARTLENGAPLCSWCDTQECAKRGGECSLFDYGTLLEWLRGGV